MSHTCGVSVWQASLPVCSSDHSSPVPLSTRKVLLCLDRRSCSLAATNTHQALIFGRGPLVSATSDSYFTVSAKNSETWLQPPARHFFFFCFSSTSSLNELKKNFYGPAVGQRSHRHLSPPCTTQPSVSHLEGKQASLRITAV